MKISEEYVVKQVVKFLEKKPDGNWNHDKPVINSNHEHGADIIMVGGKKCGEHFCIECKGKSYAKSANVINKEGWLTALGQLIQRIDVNRFTKSKNDKSKSTINRAYKYGLGLYWISAQVALRRIPKSVAQALNLYIFSVSDKGVVKQFTPSQFGKEYPDGLFKR